MLQNWVDGFTVFWICLNIKFFELSWVWVIFSMFKEIKIKKNQNTKTTTKDRKIHSINVKMNRNKKRVMWLKCSVSFKVNTMKSTELWNLAYWLCSSLSTETGWIKSVYLIIFQQCHSLSSVPVTLDWLWSPLPVQNWQYELKRWKY